MSKKTVIGTTSVGLFSSVLAFLGVVSCCRNTCMARHRGFTVELLRGISPTIYRNRNRRITIWLLAGLFQEKVIVLRFRERLLRNSGERRKTEITACSEGVFVDRGNRGNRHAFYGEPRS